MDGLQNKAMVAKAAVDTSTLGNGGRMNAEQQTKFITFMKDYSGFLKRINFIKMLATTRNIDKLNVNKRSMRQQNEGTNNVPAGGVVHKRRKLTAIGTCLGYDITKQYYKENIEGPGAGTTIAKLMAQQFSNDTVDLAFNGDENSADQFLSINDGYIKIATEDSGTHKYEHQDSKDYLNKIFPEMLEMVPNEYYQLFQEENKNLFTFFVSPNVNLKYKLQLQERGTNLGDKTITDGANVGYLGHEIFPIGFLPDDVMILTPDINLIFGLYGNSLESYKEFVPRRTLFEHTLLSDFDMEIAEPDALVIAKKEFI